ncbi:hypothetical protein [Falsiroseomonas oryziterrae]|uniref:hypothetical protein n=1 Tax=Falsiroseomonas oryziterrae TaxID=2911368 RepID=UPI001F466E7F|nr:hypothetical protein [Roseomonas sp. NPKOSM-4]
MEAFFSSGRVADLILLVLAVEAALLLAWRRRTGHGPSPRAVLALVLPGVALVIALRFALTGAWWGWIALVLLAAFAAHLFDLATRWRG